MLVMPLSKEMANLRPGKMCAASHGASALLTAQRAWAIFTG